MTDTLIQRLRHMAGDCNALAIFREAADALEQQAAQIAEKDAEIARLHKALDSAYAQAMENGATANALRADAERYRWLCRNNFDRESIMQIHTWIQTWEPHSQTGEPTQWTQRVRGGAYLSEVIDAALRQEQPTKGEGA